MRPFPKLMPATVMDPFDSLPIKMEHRSLEMFHHCTLDKPRAPIRRGPLCRRSQLTPVVPRQSPTIVS